MPRKKSASQSLIRRKKLSYSGSPTVRRVKRMARKAARKKY